MLPDKATLIVTLDVAPGMVFEVRAPITGPFIRQFDPVDSLEPYSPLVAMATGGKTSDEVRVVNRRREGYAKTLAEAITDQIMKSMQQRDTVNGYPIEESSGP